jgi:hypothetical protein
VLPSLYVLETVGWIALHSWQNVQSHPFWFWLLRLAPLLNLLLYFAYLLQAAFQILDIIKSFPRQPIKDRVESFDARLTREEDLVKKLEKVSPEFLLERQKRIEFEVKGVNKSKILAVMLAVVGTLLPLSQGGTAGDSWTITSSVIAVAPQAKTVASLTTPTTQTIVSPAKDDSLMKLFSKPMIGGFLIGLLAVTLIELRYAEELRSLAYVLKRVRKAKLRKEKTKTHRVSV